MAPLSAMARELSDRTRKVQLTVRSPFRRCLPLHPLPACPPPPPLHPPLSVGGLGPGRGAWGRGRGKASLALPLGGDHNAPERVSLTSFRLFALGWGRVLAIRVIWYASHHLPSITIITLCVACMCLRHCSQRLSCRWPAARQWGSAVRGRPPGT